MQKTPCAFWIWQAAEDVSSFFFLGLIDPCFLTFMYMWYPLFGMPFDSCRSIDLCLEQQGSGYTSVWKVGMFLFIKCPTSLRHCCRCFVGGVSEKGWFIFLLLPFFHVPLSFCFQFILFFSPKTRACKFFKFLLIQVLYCISEYFLQTLFESIPVKTTGIEFNTASVS